MNLAEIMREKTNEASVKQNAEALQNLKNEILAKIQDHATNGKSEILFYIGQRPRPLGENVGIVIPFVFEADVRNWLVSEGFDFDYTSKKISW